MNVIQVHVADIDVGERLRAVDPAYVSLLAASMRAEGQRMPIEVRKVRGGKYALIAGAHRLAALQEAEIDEAQVIVRTATALEATLLEIDENLIRHELTPLDKATFLARRKEVYEELHPETKHGGDRKSDQVLNLENLIDTFAEATAVKLGLSRQTIARSVARYTHIQPDVRERVSGTWIADSGAQLDELARQTPEMQRKIADFIVQWPAVKKVSEIIRQLESRPAPKPATTLEKFLTLWRKASADDRRQIIDHLAPELPGFETRRAA